MMPYLTTCHCKKKHKPQVRCKMTVCKMVVCKIQDKTVCEKMVIFAFLKRFKSDNQITCDFKIKTK